ncbi:glycosyltransferase [Rhodobacterales bacterium HKCCA1058]|nr:glycosyltransferase [Rhodobacterales bacterium HKCCA1058]
MIRFDNLHPWSVQPKRSEYLFSKNTPVWTLVMPIYNKEKIIIDVLEYCCKNTEFYHDVVLINDGSTDATKIQLEQFLKGLARDAYKVCRLTLFDVDYPIFETACDNLGFIEARTDNIIEIQSDLYMLEPNYDSKLISLLKTGKFSSVGGRLIHDFGLIIGGYGWLKFPYERARRRIFRTIPEGEGLLGRKIFDTSKLEFDHGAYFTGETVARGPWALSKSLLNKLNYLDQENYFLGYDDHDFHSRCFEYNGNICAYVPINIRCLPEDGSTRQVRSGKNDLIFRHLKDTKRGSKNFKMFLRNYRPYAPITRCGRL